MTSISAKEKSEATAEIAQTACQPIYSSTSDLPKSVQTADAPKIMTADTVVKHSADSPDKKSTGSERTVKTDNGKNKLNSSQGKNNNFSDTKSSKSESSTSSEVNNDTSGEAELSNQKAALTSMAKSSEENKTNSSKSKTDNTSSKLTTDTEKNKDDAGSKPSSNVEPSIVSPPEKYQIKVGHINQNSEMPTGCEIVSTKIVLDYYGKDKSLDDIYSHMSKAMLKTSKDGKLYGKTPYDAFIGNPKKQSGFGCYPPVISELMTKYDFDDLYTESTCGLPLDFIAETYLTQDIPVLVWATIGMQQSCMTDSWYVEDQFGNPTKEKYTWRAAEHCLVLTGYDKKYYYFSDPLSYSDVTKYERNLVEKRYKEVGSYSLLIRKYEE